MSCSEPGRALAVLLLLLAGKAAAEHVVSLGLEADSENSKAVALLGSFGVAEDTWASISASRSESRDRLFNLETWYLDLGIDHYFDPIGVRASIAYWGDAELLDSNDLSAAVYWKNERASLSLDYERRAFDLTIRSLLLDQPRRVEFDADGIGLSARVELGEAVSVYANGMSYDYSRNISLTPNRDVLRVFALSRLSMVNSLLDQRLSAGVEFSFGDRVLDLRAARWETAVFGDRVDALGIGLLTPLGPASDLELRLETDDSDAAGRATLFSVFFYFYGD